MPRSRVFIAVDIGDTVRAKAHALQETLARTSAEVKWVEPGNLHITLLFLGEVDDRELHRVCRAAQDVAATEPPFPLHVSGMGAFPTPRRPKVVWAGIGDGTEALVRLYGKLEATMLDLGCLRKEERGYTPHLTLGRVRSERDGHALAPELTRRLAWDGGRTTVEEILVFSSTLERAGPTYTVLGRGALNAAVKV